MKRPRVYICVLKQHPWGDWQSRVFTLEHVYNNLLILSKVHDKTAFIKEYLPTIHA